MPSRKINEFSQKGNRKKIELVARPGTIKCKKSCMKFDGWTTDQQKRVIVRDCGYYSTTECFNGKLDSRSKA